MSQREIPPANLIEGSDRDTDLGQPGIGPRRRPWRLLFAPQICFILRRVIDIHSHILPEVDDGPKSWETAEAMCRIAAEDGIEHMVATPHANDRYFYDRVYFTELVASLQQRIGEKPRLSLGCDF